MSLSAWGLIGGIVGAIIVALSARSFVRDRGGGYQANASSLGFTLRRLPHPWGLRLQELADRFGPPLGWSLITLGFGLQLAREIAGSQGGASISFDGQAWSAAIQAAATVVLVAVTVWYVRLTSSLARAARDQADAAKSQADEAEKARVLLQRPRIVIRTVIHPRILHSIELQIENLGGTPAYGLSFRLSRDEKVADNRMLSDLGVLKNGLGVLAPREPFRTPLLWALDGEVFDAFMTSPPELSVNYSDDEGTEFEETFSLSISEYEAYTRFDADPFEKMEKHLGKLSDTIDGISKGRPKPKVVSYTLDEEEAELSTTLLFHKMRSLRGEARDRVEALVDEMLRAESGSGGRDQDVTR